MVYVWCEGVERWCENGACVNQFIMGGKSASKRDFGAFFQGPKIFPALGSRKFLLKGRWQSRPAPSSSPVTYLPPKSITPLPPCTAKSRGSEKKLRKLSWKVRIKSLLAARVCSGGGVHVFGGFGVFSSDSHDISWSNSDAGIIDTFLVSNPYGHSPAHVQLQAAMAINGSLQKLRQGKRFFASGQCVSIRTPRPQIGTLRLHFTGSGHLGWG